MPKFQVGDYVIGNEEANKHYGITRHGWIGVVSRASSRRNDFIAVSSVDYDEFGLYDEYGEPYGYCLDDEVILVAAPADDPARENGFWSPLMDKFVGMKGTIVYVDERESDPLPYEVKFDPMNDEIGNPIRDYWFCKDEWLCLAGQKEIDTSSIDNFFSEF